MTTFQARGVSLTLTPLKMDGVPQEWRPFLDVSRPDVAQAWARLRPTPTGPATPAAILARFESGHLQICDGDLVTAEPKAKRVPRGLPKVVNGERVPPAPSSVKKAAMAANRIPLEKRPNWTFVVRHRDQLRYSDCAALLGCTHAAIAMAVHNGRLPKSRQE